MKLFVNVGEATVLLLIMSSNYADEMRYEDMNEEPVLNDYENENNVISDETKTQYDELASWNANNWNNIEYNGQMNRRRDDSILSRTSNVKNLIKGAVNKVRSWFGKRSSDSVPNQSNDPNVGRGAETNFFSGIIKGIGNIFKNPARGRVRKDTERRKEINIPNKPASVPVQTSWNKTDRHRVVRAVAAQTLKPTNKTRGWVPGHFGYTPKGAFVAGHNFDGNEVYVAKATVGEKTLGLCPGTLLAGRRCVRVPFKGWSRCEYKYEILIGNSYVWYPSYKSLKYWELPPNALIGGREDFNGGILINYVCRTMMKGEILIGKLHIDEYKKQSYRMCVVAYKGKSEITPMYDILLDWWWAGSDNQ